MWLKYRHTHQRTIPSRSTSPKAMGCAASLRAPRTEATREASPDIGPHAPHPSVVGPGVSGTSAVSAGNNVDPESQSRPVSSPRRTATAEPRGPRASFFLERPSSPLRQRIFARNLRQRRPPPILDLSCIPGPKTSILISTPTPEERSSFPYFCPICFSHADSVFACVECGHHVCGTCLLTMIRSKIDKENKASSEEWYQHGAEVFAKAMPGSTINCQGLLNNCPHCRDQDLLFKRLCRHSNAKTRGNIEENIRTYVDSPRTIELLSSVESSKSVHDVAAKTVEFAVKTALTGHYRDQCVHAAQNRPETE